MTLGTLKKIPSVSGAHARTRSRLRDGAIRLAASAVSLLAPSVKLAGNLRHGRHRGGVQLVELGKVVEDGIQVTQHGRLLATRQFEIREFGNTLDVLLGNTHLYADLEKSTAQELARLETQQKAVS